MRPGLVRNLGLGISVLALVWLAACNDNPLSFDVKDTTGILTNPSEMVISAGRTAKLESRTVNQGGAATFEVITWAIDPTCGGGAITVADDPDDAPLIEAGVIPPGRFSVTAGSTLGQSCVVLTGGGQTEQVDVTVVAEAVLFTSGPDTLRAGETGLMTAGLFDTDGNPILPYDPLDAGWTSESSDVADFTDPVDGNFFTEVSGTAVFTVTWIGQEANGTVVPGVGFEDTHVLTVIANVPFAAELAAAFPGLGLPGEATVEVLVLDALGNQNTNPAEITACAALSSDLLVATVVCEVVPGGEVTGPVRVDVTVTAVGPGTSDISGTVTTTEGPMAFGPSTVTVIAPSITGLSATSGGFAETVTITGVGLAAAGFNTLVFMDGEQLGNFTVVSDTEITAQVGTWAAPGDHLVTVEVNDIANVELLVWTQTNSCNANDFTDPGGYDGPVVPTSLPLQCNGTASDLSVADTWFVTDISEDALGGVTEIDVTLTPTWGAPLKDIDWLYCGTGIGPPPPWAQCVFEVDQPPSTATLSLGTGDHLWLMDDYAAWNNDDFTVQDYTVSVTID